MGNPVPVGQAGLAYLPAIFLAGFFKNFVVGYFFTNHVSLGATHLRSAWHLFVAMDHFFVVL